MTTGYLRFYDPKTEDALDLNEYFAGCLLGSLMVLLRFSSLFVI